MNWVWRVAFILYLSGNLWWLYISSPATLNLRIPICLVFISHYFINTAPPTPNTHTNPPTRDSKREKIRSYSYNTFIYSILNYKNTTDAQLSTTANSKNVEGKHAYRKQECKQFSTIMGVTITLSRLIPGIHST